MYTCMDIHHANMNATYGTTGGTATEFVYQKLFMAYAWEPYGGYILYKYKV